MFERPRLPHRDCLGLGVWCWVPTWIMWRARLVCCLDISSGCSLCVCQHEACGEQDLSAVWSSSPLVVVCVFANIKHVENKTCLLSGHLLWLESGCLVLGANMKHVENKTCLLSGHLLWLASGCLVLGLFVCFIIYSYKKYSHTCYLQIRSRWL